MVENMGGAACELAASSGGNAYTATIFVSARGVFHAVPTILLAAVAVLVVIAGSALACVALARARAPAPVSVPAVIAVAAALAAVASWRWLGGEWPPWWLPVPLALAASAVPLAAADLRHRRLPDVLTLPLYPVVATALSVAALAGPGFGLLVRAFAVAVVFGGLHLLIHALARSSLGAGDVKLAGSLGAVLGAVSWSAMVVGAVLAAFVTAALAVARRWRRGVPHGPGLLAATWLVSLFPQTST